MWEILGLPAHPLLVHLTVVATPLIALLAIGYALIPRLRNWGQVPLAIGAVVVTVSALLSVTAGNALAESRGLMNEAVAAHQGFGQRVLLGSLVQLVTTALLLVTTVRLPERRAGFAGVFQGRAWLRGVAVVASVICSVVMITLVVLTGHSGSAAVWG